MPISLSETYIPNKTIKAMSYFTLKFFKNDEPASGGFCQMKEGELYFYVSHEAIRYLPETEFPLKFLVHNLFGELAWTGWANPNCFVTYYDSYNKIVKIETTSGQLLTKWEFNDMMHGDICYQVFKTWSLYNKGSRGIAIGVNDGHCGEWVSSVMSGDLFAVLVEPTKAVCQKLRQYWSGYDNVKIEECLVTNDGSDVTFYQGENTVCNSIVEEHVKVYNSGQATGELMKSQTVEQLCKKWNISGKWWLHIDCEGYDHKIIYSLDKMNLPQIIVFEHVNFDNEVRAELLTYLDSLGYYTQLTYMNGVSVLS